MRSRGQRSCCHILSTEHGPGEKAADYRQRIPCRPERQFQRPRHLETRLVSHRSGRTAGKRAAESDQGKEQRIAYGVEFGACKRRSDTSSPLHQGKSKADIEARVHSRPLLRPSPVRYEVAPAFRPALASSCAP